MNRAVGCFTIIGAAIAFFATPQANAATVDFETVALGTVYGSPTGDAVGAIVLSQEGILMSLQNFTINGSERFGDATIGGRYTDFFDSTPLELDNISVLFDFGDLSFVPDAVDLDFVYFGGMNNFSVNGQQLFELASLGDLPASVAPGVTATVSDEHISLSGAVQSLLIGGQELSIDNITVVPEPTTVALLALASAVLLRRRMA